MLGSPIGHSLSPVLHEAAYRSLGLDGWTYQRIECQDDEFARLVDGFGSEWIGLSLTMPLKRVVLEVADEVSPLAAAVGSGNTLIFRDSGRFADNTDVAGILVSLREAGVSRASNAAILGAGGTAQAALAALRDLGATQPLVLVRNASRTGELQATADRLGMQITIFDGLLERAIPDVELVISTLPGDAAQPVTAHPWPTGATLLDVVYSPWPTALASHARRSGSVAIGGLAVLLHQAVAQVDMMTGQQAPVEVMRAALEQATGIKGIGRP